MLLRYLGSLFWWPLSLKFSNRLYYAHAPEQLSDPIYFIALHFI